MAAMPPATEKPRKTVEDYLALPDDVRAELIDGELYVTPSPVPDHQRVLLRLARVLGPRLEAVHEGEVFIAPLDVHLPSGDVVQPDVLYVAKGNRGIIQDWIRGVPDLVVEIVSPTGAERDRIVKRDLYARNGVPEYWIVDPGERSVEVLRLAGKQYRAAGWFRGDMILRSPGFPTLALPLTEFFAVLG